MLETKEYGLGGWKSDQSVYILACPAPGLVMVMTSCGHEYGIWPQSQLRAAGHGWRLQGGWPPMHVSAVQQSQSRPLPPTAASVHASQAEALASTPKNDACSATRVSSAWIVSFASRAPCGHAMNFRSHQLLAKFERTSCATQKRATFREERPQRGSACAHPPSCDQSIAACAKVPLSRGTACVHRPGVWIPSSREDVYWCAPRATTVVGANRRGH